MKRSKRTRLSKPKSSGTSRVGYGRPPAHTQFKRGQSGNPKGRPGSKARPKGLQENPGTLMLKILSEKLHLREGERVLSVSKLEALLRGAVAKAIKGDGRALEMILELFSEARELAGSSQEQMILVRFVAPDGSMQTLEEFSGMKPEPAAQSAPPPGRLKRPGS